jgi:2'-5' RNA ligase
MRSARAAPTERLFLGVPLTSPAREALRAQLPEVLPGGPVPAENWHVTLKFLGDTPPGLREELIAELRSAPMPRSFTVEFSSIGAFPVPRRAKVVWVGVGAGRPELEAVASLAEATAVRLGFNPQLRPFHPHVTIARLKRALDAATIVRDELPAPVRMPVTALALFRSRPGNGPAHYDIQQLFSLV